MRRQLVASRVTFWQARSYYVTWQYVNSDKVVEQKENVF